MAKSVYLISEAAKEVCVENHVLRYWEEELALPVKRNSQGHRYYTMEDLNTFKRIKYLKEQGLQLKAIKLFLSKDGHQNASLILHQGDKVTAFCKETSPHGMTEQNTSRQAAPKLIKEGNAALSASRPTKEGNAALPVSRPAKEGNAALLVSRPAEEGNVSLSASKLIRDEAQIRQEDRNEKAQKLQMILKLMIEEVLREYDSDLKEGLKEEISERLCTDVKDAVIKEMDYQFRMQEEREEKRGQEREERDQELLQRINEVLMSKKAEKRDKKTNKRAYKTSDKAEKTDKMDDNTKVGNTDKEEMIWKGEIEDKPEKPFKKKKPGIFQWKAKSSLS